MKWMAYASKNTEAGKAAIDTCYESPDQKLGGCATLFSLRCAEDVEFPPSPGPALSSQTTRRCHQTLHACRVWCVILVIGRQKTRVKGCIRAGSQKNPSEARAA
jgi:hypothetical protein